MAYSVTALVRRARLPHTIRHRPLAKLCLLALADRCEPDGTEARPALATIAAESEVADTRTIAAALRDLAKHGLIREQRPPTQRKPRCWALDLDAIDALAPRLPLFEAGLGVQPDAPLGATADPPEVQIELPEVHAAALEVHPACARSGPLDPIHLIPSKKTNVDLAPIRQVIRELLDRADAPPSWAAITELADQACRARGVDVGTSADHAIARAYVLEHMRARFAVQNRTARHAINS